MRPGRASRPGTTHTDTQGMKNSGHRSHNPSEDLRGRGQTEAQRFELVSAAMSHKAQEAMRFQMHRNLKIRLPKVDGGHPTPLPDRQKNRLDGLHAEVRNVHEAIKEGQVDDRSPRPRGLPNHKQAAVKARRGKRSKLHSTLGNQRQGDLLKSSPLDGSRGIRRHGMGSVNRGGGLRKGMRYPSRRTSTTHGSAPLSLQACQWRDRQPPDRVRQGDGSYFQKPEGFEGADPLPSLSACGLQSASLTAAPDEEDGSQMDRREATKTLP